MPSYVCLSVYLSVCLSVHVSVDLRVYCLFTCSHTSIISIYLSVFLFVCLCLSTRLSVCLYVYVCTHAHVFYPYLCQIVHLPVHLSIHTCIQLFLKVWKLYFARKWIRSFCELQFFYFSAVYGISLSFEVFILSALGVTLFYTQGLQLTFCPKNRVFFPRTLACIENRGEGCAYTQRLLLCTCNFPWLLFCRKSVSFLYICLSHTW